MGKNSIVTATRLACATSVALNFVAFVLIVCAVRPVYAATEDDRLTVEIVQWKAGDAAGEQWAIYLNGRIDEGAAERLRDELARQEVPSATVYLNSPGGDLKQGLELGRLIRERGYSTNVARRNPQGLVPFAGECYSACVFVFIGGTYRLYSPRSRIGVHRFYSMSSAGVDGDSAQIVSAVIVNYIRSMDVDVGLFDRMSRAGKNEMLVLPKADLERLHVINYGRLPAEWTIESMDGTIYLKGAQQTSLGVGEILLSCNGGRVVFRAQFDAGDNAEAVRDSAQQHLIRFGDAYVPLADPLQTISVQDHNVMADFVLSREQINRLPSSPTVGYAARLGYPNVFAGFSVDTAGPAKAKISSFLKNCDS